MNWDGEIDRVLAREGGWSDRAEDKGGPTNLGITLATYSRWLGRGARVDELKALSVADARKIYMQFFVKDPGIDQLGSDALMAVMFDWAVNSGPAVPIRALQRQLGVVVDGVIGPQTLALAATRDGLRLGIRLILDRVEFIADWMRNDRRDADRDGVPDSMENAAGILKRITAQARGLV